MRWPDGISCPRCDCHSVGAIPARRRFYCRGCKHQFSLTSGTIFHNSHLPVWKWFVAIELLLEADEGLPANRLVELLGGSYKSAWFVEHRIRRALLHVVERQKEVRPPSAYHRPGARYLPAYDAEARWRERYRGEASGFRETVEALLAAEPISYSELIGAQDALRIVSRTA